MFRNIYKNITQPQYLRGMKGLSGDRNWGIHGLLTGFQQEVGGGKGKFNPNGNLGCGTKTGDPRLDPGWSKPWTDLPSSSSSNSSSNSDSSLSHSSSKSKSSSKDSSFLRLRSSPPHPALGSSWISGLSSCLVLLLSCWFSVCCCLTLVARVKFRIM